MKTCKQHPRYKIHPMGRPRCPECKDLVLKAAQAKLNQIKQIAEVGMWEIDQDNVRMGQRKRRVRA